MEANFRRLNYLHTSKALQNYAGSQVPPKHYLELAVEHQKKVATIGFQGEAGVFRNPEKVSK